MFWHSAVNNNAIDNLLDQPDCTLLTILDQDEVLMEIRGMNKKLIEFLTRPECMREMLDLITTVPSADIPLPLQYKYPNTACEVLTSDISFAEKIAAEPQLMQRLFHFFRDQEPPLNPLLASYVCRMLGEMVARKLDQNWYSYQLNLIQVMGYLQSEVSLLDWLMKHVETSSVCDFFHKLVMNVEGQDMRASLYEWLEVKENFVVKLVNSMDRLHNKEAHMNICRLVGDLLFALQDETSSPSQDRSIDSEPFLIALKSHATFERLLDVIFGEDTLSQSSIVYGLDILLALLGIAKKPVKPNPEEPTPQPTLVTWPCFSSLNLLSASQNPAQLLISPNGFYMGMSIPSLDSFENGRLKRTTPAEKPVPVQMPTLKKVDASYETNEDVILPNSVRNTLLNKMSTLMRFLQNPPGIRQPLRLSNGVLNEPLGMERLAIVKFVAHIITLHDTELNDALISQGILRKVMDLMWEHPWNNFLHHYVCQIVIQITKITRSNSCARFLFIDYAFPDKILQAFEDPNLKAGYLGHLAKMTHALMDSLEMNETVKSVIAEMDEVKPEVKQKFKDFYEGTWKTYNETANQLLAGAALPTSVVSMSSNTHNYDSDPGVTWDSSSGTGLNADHDDFFDPSSCSNFGTDRYDDEKSKAIFEMFCFERSNSAEDEDEDASFHRNNEPGVDATTDSIPYEAGQTNALDISDSEFGWQNSNSFLKQLEEQEMFSQLSLNGSMGGGSSSNSGNPSSSNFIANPWAGQESVQVGNTDPWATFEFTSNNNPSNNATNDNNWANFDESFAADFAAFVSASDLPPSEFPVEPEDLPAPSPQNPVTAGGDASATMGPVPGPSPESSPDATPIPTPTSSTVSVPDGE